MVHRRKDIDAHVESYAQCTDWLLDGVQVVTLIAGVFCLTSNWEEVAAQAKKRRALQ